MRKRSHAANQQREGKPNMAIQQLEHLNDVQLDVLKEIGNIGAGNAATSLAGLLNEQVHMTLPNVRIVDVNEAVTLLGGP